MNDGRTVYVPVGQFFNETNKSRHNCVQSEVLEKKDGMKLLKKINNRRKKREKGNSKKMQNTSLKK